MPRLKEEDWINLKDDYEVNFLSVAELSLKYGVNRSNINRRRNKEKWSQGDTEKIICATVENKKQAIALQNASNKLNASKRTKIESEVSYRLRMNQELEESGYLAAKANNIVARDLVATMEHTGYESEKAPLKTIESVASIYQKLHKSAEPKTVINNNQVSNTLNLTLEEEKQELMNILNAYD